MPATPRERVLASLRGEVLDRPPFALWRHFYDAEGGVARYGARRSDREDKGPGELADAMIGWARTYGFDLLKYNPRARYHVEPFESPRSAALRAQGPLPLGHLPVAPPGAPMNHPDRSRGPYPLDLRGPPMYGTLPRRPAPLGHATFREMLDGLHLARAALGDLPILMTVFTPLAVCASIVGRERFADVLRAEPERFEEALPVIAETFAAFATACLHAGADGIFLATLPIASRDVLSDEEYARFGRPYDVRILEPLGGALNVLHVCGERTRVLELADYPNVAALSWNAHGAGNPSLGRVRAAGRVAVGGLSDRALLQEDERLVREEIADGFRETAGRGWISAGGCTVPPESSDRAIRAARAALEG